MRARERDASIGRIYEELRNYEAARAEYGKLVDRYRGTDAAEDARFRIPWSLYMAHQYARAAAASPRCATRPRAHRNGICLTTGAPLAGQDGK